MFAMEQSANIVQRGSQVEEWKVPVLDENRKHTFSRSLLSLFFSIPPSDDSTLSYRAGIGIEFRKQHFVAFPCTVLRQIHWFSVEGLLCQAILPALLAVVVIISLTERKIRAGSSEQEETHLVSMVNNLMFRNRQRNYDLYIWWMIIAVKPGFGTLNLIGNP